MTDKQKEAIELLKKLRFSSDEYYIVDGAYAKDIDYLLIENAIETVLNIIQTQQAEIEQLKNKNKHQSKEIQKAVDYTFELNTELEKKDKIIDEMAKYVASKELLIDKQLNILTSDCVKKYFERKSENGN